MVCGLYISGNGHLVKAVRSTYLIGKTGPSIDDHLKFENRYIKADKHRPWDISQQYNSASLSQSEEQTFDDWQSVAYLIIKDDSILFENYWEDYDERSYSNSFSVAKSLVSLAVGAAINNGCIQSFEQKVSDFLDEYNVEGKRDIRIIDLLQMSCLHQSCTARGVALEGVRAKSLWV